MNDSLSQVGSAISVLSNPNLDVDVYILKIDYKQLNGDQLAKELWVDSAEVGIDKRTLLMVMQTYSEPTKPVAYLFGLILSCFAVSICIGVAKQVESSKREQRRQELEVGN